jgi:quinol monooxygenase YgiN
MCPSIRIVGSDGVNRLPFDAEYSPQPKENRMSVLIALKFQGNVEVFTESLTSMADEYMAISAEARHHGALHHRFATGGDYVLVVDEWESADAFYKFFADPGLQKFIARVGADTSVQPEITVAQVISSPDQF